MGAIFSDACVSCEKQQIIFIFVVVDSVGQSNKKGVISITVASLHLTLNICLAEDQSGHKTILDLEFFLRRLKLCPQDL